MSYRIELPVFSGPLDLLLHLVKQAEVDIHDVSIARILDCYLEHLTVLESLDLNDIGEFLVMASTLMEIKSRDLLPKEEVDLEEDFNPRDDLIRRLLEYKRYRDLSRRLERFSQRRARMEEARLSLPKELSEREEDDDALLDLGDLEIWNLTEAFARLLAETGTDRTMHVAIDRRSVTFYVSRILDLLKPAGELRFEELFERGEGRLALIGTFQAMLELMKQGFLQADQPECFAPIVVRFVGPGDLSADQVADGLTAHGPDDMDDEDPDGVDAPADTSHDDAAVMADPTEVAAAPQPERTAEAD